MTEQQSKRHRQRNGDDPDGATSESPTLTDTDLACADHDASTASAALPRAATAAPQATTTATAESSKRQLTMAESFQRTTRRRADDPCAAARPPLGAPPPIPIMNNAARCSTTLCGPPAKGLEFSAGGLKKKKIGVRNPRAFYKAKL